jgi:hypothetical protein
LIDFVPELLDVTLKEERQQARASQLEAAMEWLALLVLGSCVIPGIPSPFEQGHIFGNVGG